jgi:hypothetical protein
MTRLSAVAALAVLFFVGCGGGSNNPAGPGEVDQTGKIVVAVTWPQGVAGKTAGVLRDAPDKISVYLYRSNKEVTRADLKHEGTRGTAELTVAAQSGYRLEIVALDESFNQVLYTGFKDNITVSANVSTPVDISMSDAAPVLSPARSTGDSSYVLTWTRVPLATAYLIEESPSEKLVSGVLLEDTKFSTTVYTGSDSTKAITGKAPGTYYYTVYAVTPYGKTYSVSPAGQKNWDFYVAVKYGAFSNMISVQSGSNGIMKIDIPWPSK